MKKSKLDKQLLKTGCSRLTPPATLETWLAFLDHVSTAYQHAAADRELLERAIEISSREMQDKIHESEQMAIELVEASRLTALGTMASGMAHELNNPIAGIKGHAQLLLQTELTDPNRKRIDRIVARCDRMATIVGSVKRLSRRTQPDELNNFDLRHIVADAVDLFRSQLSFDRIAILTDLPTEPLRVFGDAVAMVSVIQNLIGNSRDAFLANNINEARIFIQAKKTGESILLTYLDNAGGIAPHILSRIFEPFFTTKEPGSGTGLGLALTKRIVEDHKGSCAVSSKGDQTKFLINLPVSQHSGIDNLAASTEAAGVKKATVDATKPVVGLVDDEADIVEMLSEYLSKDFHVLAFTDPEVALRELSGIRVDVLLTDVRMPGMSGHTLGAALRRLDPYVSIVTMSGHVFGDAEETIDIEFDDHIVKPFASLDSVKATLSNVLEHKNQKALKQTPGSDSAA